MCATTLCFLDLPGRVHQSQKSSSWPEPRHHVLNAMEMIQIIIRIPTGPHTIETSQRFYISNLMTQVKSQEKDIVPFTTIGTPLASNSKYFLT